ncbi:MAG: hypothetical protein KJO07_01685 [Deltaproteobacteria bacterium]|jgi:hypothetical protein|nr:hypothetical protein [Deltaproteobacteria bacterium]
MIRLSKLSTVLALAGAVSLCACAAGGGDEVDEPVEAGETEPVPGPDQDDDDDSEPPPGPASPYANLPACEGAQADYHNAGVISPVEVVDFFGPNISLTLGFSDDVVVIYPAGNDFGTGTFEIGKDDEWAVELCVNWDDDAATCEATIPAVEGFVRLTQVDEDDVLSFQVEGSLDSVYFADDADDPTCASRVDYGFQFPLD